MLRSLTSLFTNPHAEQALACNLCRGLLDGVLTLVGYPLVYLRNLDSLLLSVIRPLLLPRELPLLLLQALLGLLEVLAVPVAGAVGAGGECLDAHIDTEHIGIGLWHSDLGHRLSLHLYEDARIEVASGLDGDRDGLHLALEPPMEDAGHPADLRHMERLLLEVHLAVLRILEVLAPVLPLELRVAYLPGIVEEVRVGGVQVSQGRLKGLAVGLSKPGLLLLENVQQPDGVTIALGLAPPLIGLLPELQPLVEDMAATACMLPEEARLTVCRPEPELVRLNHACIILHAGI